MWALHTCIHSNLQGPLRPNRARRRRPLKFGRRRRTPPPSTPSPSFLPSKLQRVVRKQTLPFFISLSSRAPRRHSPTAGRPPPWMPYLGRHPFHPCKCVVEFARSQASRRCFPHANPWPGAQFGSSPATPPPCATAAGASAASQPHAGVAGRRIGHQRPQSVGPAGQTRKYRSTGVIFFKRPLVLLISQAGPSTS
jgi:hypothetical protein